MDTSILLTTNALLSAAAAIVMLVVLRTRKTYPGFGFWTAGVACLALGAAMLVPNVLPQGWAVRVARNAMLLGGFALILRGMLVFRGYRVRHGLELGLALSFLLVFGWFSRDAADLEARIVIYCVYATGLSLATMQATLRRRPPHFGSNDVMLAVWMAVVAALNLLRIVHQLADSGPGTAFEALQGFGTFYAMAQILTVQLVTLTLISMNSQRIEHEYRLGEQALRKREEQLRSMGDNLPDGFVYQYEAVEGRPRFRYASAGVGRIFGLAPEAVMADAQPLFAMADPDSLRQYLEDEARSARELSVYSGTVLFNLADGRKVWLHVRSSPLRQPDGGVVWDGVAIDVTQRRQAELELQRYRDHLEAMVQERTAQLREAQVRAEAASVAKSAFLANMSHEIRTPMNAILGLTHLLAGEQPTPRQAGQLARIEDAARHLLSIINDILDLTKIEAGKVRLEERDFHLPTLLEQVRSMVGSAAAAKGVLVNVDADPALPPWLCGDDTRVRQALLNYAGNAVKFTSAGSVTLRVRLQEQEQERPDARDGGAGRLLLRFEVEDTGVGITPQQLERLFEAFEQADASTTREHGGTGLGLTITRRLAGLMGGSAGAMPREGGGSVFWFTAWLGPARDAHPPAAAPGAAAVAPETDPEAALLARHAGARVLVAEDHPVNREVALVLLQAVGLEADFAENGRVAVDKARDGAYDLVLMDMQMPVMDGLQAARTLRALPNPPRMPILAMTANAFGEDRQACLDAGMDDFISKPVEPRTLYGTLLHWLERQAVNKTDKPSS